jgi:hypothetical protein
VDERSDEWLLKKYGSSSSFLYLTKNHISTEPSTTDCTTPFTSHQHKTMAQKVNLTDPDFEGYLTKQSAWLKEWRKRYFVLKENQLHFCKQKGVDPHGTVDLQQCLTVKSAEEKTGKR